MTSNNIIAAQGSNQAAFNSLNIDGNVSSPQKGHNTPLVTTSTIKSTTSSFSSGRTQDTSPNANQYDATVLSGKLNGTNHIADAFQIMTVIHQLFVEMRRQAAESKQDAYQMQWTALESKVEKLKSAAAKEFAGAMVNGGIGIVGGVAGMRAGKTAMSNTSKAGKVQVEIKALNKQINNSINNSPKPSLQAKPKILLDDNPLTTPQTAATGQMPQAANNNPNVNTPTTKPGDAPSNKLSLKQMEAKRDRLQGDSAILSSDASTAANSSQVYSQFGTALGTSSSSVLTYLGQLDRAEGERQTAQATKAQADVDSEMEFVRSAAEGSKAVQAFLEQAINARAQVNNKLMA